MNADKKSFPNNQIVANSGDVAVLVGSKSFEIEPDDNTDIKYVGANIFLSKSGNVALSLINDDDFSLPIVWPLQAGFQPLSVKRVWSTGTDNSIKIIGVN